MQKVELNLTDEQLADVARRAAQQGMTLEEYARKRWAVGGAVESVQARGCDVVFKDGNGAMRIKRVFRPVK